MEEQKKNINVENTTPKNEGKKDFRSTFKARRGGRSRDRSSDVNRRVLSSRRVSRVVAGGRRFSLSVAVAVGDGNGSVGIGTGKGSDTAIAIQKATAQAKKNMVKLPITKDKGIPCDSKAKYCSSVVVVRPSQGFVAGGAVRTIAELAGIKNINAKILSRSKNHLTNARATVLALSKCSL